MATREGHAVWKGGLAKGTGTASAVTSGAFGDLPVSWPARTASSDGKTSPEELIAAAHASCFAMALSGILDKQGKTPEQLDVRARVSFEKSGDGWAITSSKLRVEGQVPGMSADDFRKAAEDARDHCPVSQALKGNVQLAVDASLQSTTGV